MADWLRKVRGVASIENAPPRFCTLAQDLSINTAAAEQAVVSAKCVSWSSSKIRMGEVVKHVQVDFPFEFLAGASDDLAPTLIRVVACLVARAVALRKRSFR